MFHFALAVLLLIITPGPGVMSTAGVGAAFGYRAGLIYVIGLFIGTNVVCLMIITGLTAILFSIPEVRYVLLILSSAYLLYLAAKIAFAGTKIAFINASISPNIYSGVLLQLINPKAYTVNTALISGFAFYPSNFTVEIILKLLIMKLIWVPLHLMWLLAGVKMTSLNFSKKSQKLINYIMAMFLVIVVLLCIWSLI